MNTKGSRASTAELSRKSVEGSDTKVDPAEEEGKEDQPEGQRNEGSDENLEQKVAEEENKIQEQDNQSQHESEKSGKISPTETSTVAETELDPEKDHIPLEPPITSETNTPDEAIPIDKQELPKEELKDDEEKEKSEEKEQLTVELPPEKPEEEKEESPPMEDNEPLRTDSGNLSPAAHIDTPRPPSDVAQESVEPPIEKTTITPAENQPGIDLELGTRTPSPDGKNDSAISSSSLSPEQERPESSMGERQGTPVIEVA